MSSAPCYNGPNPVKDDERYTIWRWAKKNGIDQGMPIDKVKDNINQHFFSGMAKDEWLNDILGGRKTPLRQVSNAAWKAAYNRRVVQRQAQDLYQIQSMGKIGRTLRSMWTIPRTLETMGHGIVFPITHGGDLVFRPKSWGTFFKGTLNTWSNSWRPAAAERLISSMESRPLFETALRSGLDVGPSSHPSGLINSSNKGLFPAAWDMLKIMRYELWDQQMQKFIKPGMSQAEILDYGKNFAEWANHATGSARMSLPKSGAYLFGPKLTASKLARLAADPAKTLDTFAHWDVATPGEKAVARTRLSGLIQYAGSLLGFGAVNAGLLWALGSKQQINFFDPKKADWLAFKAGGLEFSVPGLHSELRFLGQILFTTFMSKQELRGQSKLSHAGELLGKYELNKLNPAISQGLEAYLGQDYMGRPLPWSSEKGSASQPKYSWPEYALSKGPIPLQGPIKYFYDQQRKNGASAMDALSITKAFIIFGSEFTGMKAGEDYSLNPKPAPGRKRKVQGTY